MVHSVWRSARASDAMNCSRDAHAIPAVGRLPSSPVGQAKVGSRESANPVGTVATTGCRFSPRLMGWIPSGPGTMEAWRCSRTVTRCGQRRRASLLIGDHGPQKRARRRNPAASQRNFGNDAGLTTETRCSPPPLSHHPDACADESIG